MAKEIIDEVVSSKAIEEFKQLFSHMVAVETKMNDLIENVERVKTAFSNSSGTKEASDNYNKLITVTNELNKATNERHVIEQQIKKNGADMAASVKVTTAAIDEARRIYKNFALDEKELASRIADATIKIEEQKEILKDAKGAQNYKDVLASTKLETAKLKAEVAEYSKELKRTISSMDLSETAIKKMGVELLQMKDLWRTLSEEDRASDFGIEFQAGINALDEKLKGLDESIGDNHRRIGEYELAGKSLRSQIMDIVNELGKQKIIYEQTGIEIKKQRQLVEDLTRSKGAEATETKKAAARLSEMEQGYKEAGAAILQLEQQGGKLQDVYADTRRSIKGVADDAGSSKAVAEGVGVLSNSFQVFQAGMAAVGLEGEDMMKVYAKMMIVQQGFNAVSQITNSLQSESILRLKLKAVWQKLSLAFTEKQVSATVSESVAEKVNSTAKIENTIATETTAASTTQLAGAQTVATKTSYSLSKALKSIPGIGWILGSAAVLGTLGVILYKNLTLEKEITQEQKNREKQQRLLNEINQKANESTLETIYKVRLYTSELNKVKKGSKEWQGIVTEINKLTGLQLDTIKDSEGAINKATSAWIVQYKTRAQAEAKIQKIIQSELEYDKMRNEFIDSRTDQKRREEIAKTFELEEIETKNLLYWYDRYTKAESNVGTNFTEKQRQKREAETNYLRILDTAKFKLTKNNEEIEKSIDLSKIITNENDKTNKNVEKTKDLYIDILKLKANLFSTGEDLINRNTDIELEQERLKYEEEKKRLKDHKKELEQLEEKHQLENYRIRLNGETLIQELRQKSFNAEIDNKIKLDEERQSSLTDFVERAKLSQNTALDFTSKFLEDQKNAWEEERQINLQRIDAISGLISEFGALGNAITANIKDEEKRIIVEQRVAQIELLVTKGLAIAQVLLDKGGDPWMKVIRIAANLAAVTAGFIQAQSAINQAKAYEHGTSYHTGGDAVVSEGVDGSGKYKPEIVEANGKKYYFDKPTLLKDLPIGARVKPISNMVDNYFNYQNTTKDERVVELLQSIADKSFVKIDVGENVYSHIVKGASQTRILNTQFKH